MKTHAALIAVATALALSGCGAASDNTGSTSTPTASPTKASTPTETPSPTPTVDALAACDVIGKGGDASILNRIPTILTTIQSSATAEQQQEMLAIHAALEESAELAPIGLRMHIESLDEPFAQFAEVASNGGGSLTMDTSHVATDVTNFMGSCADLGYRAQP